MDRNTVVAFALAALVFIGWEVFVAGPQREAYEAARQVAAEKAAAAQKADAARRAAGGEPAEGFAPNAAASGFAPANAGAAGGALGLDEALAQGPGRVPIDTPQLVGSINLAGARLDDLRLKNYR